MAGIVYGLLHSFFLPDQGCTDGGGGETESTGVVLAEYSPKVKLELLTTLEC